MHSCDKIMKCIYSTGEGTHRHALQKPSLILCKPPHPDLICTLYNKAIKYCSLLSSMSHSSDQVPELPTNARICKLAGQTACGRRAQKIRLASSWALMGPLVCHKPLVVVSRSSCVVVYQLASEQSPLLFFMLVYEPYWHFHLPDAQQEFRDWFNL